MAHLRRSLNVDGKVLTAADDGYMIQVDPAVIDIRRFERLVEERRHLHQTDPVEAVRASDSALGMFRGAPPCRPPPPGCQRVGLGGRYEAIAGYPEGEDRVSVAATRLLRHEGRAQTQVPPLVARMWLTVHVDRPLHPRVDSTEVEDRLSRGHVGEHLRIAVRETISEQDGVSIVTESVACS